MNKIQILDVYIEDYKISVKLENLGSKQDKWIEIPTYRFMTPELMVLQLRTEESFPDGLYFETEKLDNSTLQKLSHKRLTEYVYKAE